MQTDFQESKQSIESSVIDKYLSQGGCLKEIIGRLRDYKNKLWKGHLFYIPGGKKFGGNVGLPIEIIKIFYPNPWTIPQNCFAMNLDGEKLSFEQLLKHYESKCETHEHE